MTRSHKVDISGVLAGGHQRVLVDDEVPIEPFEGIAFPDPARVRLELRYADRMLVVDGRVDVRAVGSCDSCLEPVEQPVHADVEERFDPWDDGEREPFGDSNVIAGHRLDVADLAQQVVLSELPMGLRCGQDCRGLCGTCGENRNTSACSCDNGEIRG